MAATNTQQAEEAAAIKAAHPGRCRVMTDVGRFTHVVTVQPMNMDATIKFQLEASYPSKVPTVTVRSEALSDDDKLELQKYLVEEAEVSLNTPMIQSLVDKAIIWLKSNGMRSGKSGRSSDAQSATRTHGKKRKGKKKVVDDVVEEKLVSMKTADDVIKRIMWDGTLQSDDFLVGYWDRFRGIMEKYFSAFSWEDIASVDYTVLAIPKHRIQYFKYKTEIVWDKGSRLDNVFGSTGSKLTITDVIERYEKNRQNQDQEEDHDEDKDEDKDVDEDEDSDSDSDDGITVTIGGISSGTSIQKPTSDTNHYVAGGSKVDDWQTDNEFNPFWKDKLRPNYFVAVRVTDQEVLENLESVQDYILENEPRYSSCCIPGASLHITLCTLGLDTPEQVSNAVQALQKMKSDLKASVPKEPLRLVGVGNFFNRVIYAKVQCPETFVPFVDHVKMCLNEAGVDIRDGYEFVPHMTIMKTTRPVSRLMGTKEVSPFLYDGFADMTFGSQTIDAIHLCSMETERREDGFYLSPCHIDFTHSE
ncbi:leukocyte receptor cluster member 9-like [Haliotis asinina]|uniref:leukocyte receptor cluster member 9-like n=1 Tax=Haliotis asinina TaxID=109174 RepID=UPI003531C570